MTNNQSLIDKIRALRAKSEGTDNEHEAAAFAAKAAELMQAHNLSESAIDITEEEDEIVNHDLQFFMDPWRKSIAVAAAKLYMCGCYLTWKEHKQVFRFVGKPHNTLIASEMTQYLMKTTERLSRPYAKANPDPFMTERRVQLAFMRGCGERLASRLLDMWRETVSSEPKRSAGGNPANLPALYADEVQRVKDFMAGLKLKKGRGRGSDTFGRHSEAGAKAGEKVGLSPQVKGSKTMMIGGK